MQKRRAQKEREEESFFLKDDELVSCSSNDEFDEEYLCAVELFCFIGQKMWMLDVVFYGDMIISRYNLLKVLFFYL